MKPFNLEGIAMKKGKAKKVVIFIAIGLLAIIVVAAVLFTLFGDKLIRTAIETGGKKALQVDVRLEDISLSLLQGKVELTNLEIENPQGYEHSSFMKIGYGHVNLNTGSLMSDTVEMEKIQFDDVKLVIEQKDGTTNLEEILDNLPKSESTESKPEKEPKKEGQSKSFRIKVLEINNIEVKAKLFSTPGRADTITLKLKPIRLENLGTDEKVDAAALSAEILKAISIEITKQGTNVLPKEMLDSVKDELSKTATDAALKGLGDLFKKKEDE